MESEGEYLEYTEDANWDGIPIKNDWREDIWDNAPVAKEIYKDIKPSWFERIFSKLDQAMCFHSNLVLSKYKLVRSTSDSDKGTAREYQYIRLNPSQQKWKCFHCGKLVGTVVQAIEPIEKNSCREEHYL